MPIRLTREGPTPHPQIQEAARPAEAQAKPQADEPSAFAKLLGGLGKEVKTGEAQVHAALQSAKRGRDVGPAELLALQAGVYRYSEAVDLASKLVDRATSGVKTVVQGQS